MDHSSSDSVPTVATRILASLHLAGSVAMPVLAWSAYHVRCESFGCIGLGIVWMMWAALDLLVIILGAVARARLQTASKLYHFVLWSMRFQYILLLGLLGMWWNKG